jgi:uncharacterized protein with ATP-grasp and redox domains
MANRNEYKMFEVRFEVTMSMLHWIPMSDEASDSLKEELVLKLAAAVAMMGNLVQFIVKGIDRRLRSKIHLKDKTYRLWFDGE